MDNTIWTKHYPKGAAAEVDLTEYNNVLDVFETACRQHADSPAFSCMGSTLSYGDLDRLSADFAAYLQNHTGLQAGDRIAIQMPNILQYPVAVFGALRAGLVVVNTNPLYTEREMVHQFNDAGCKALIALANFGNLIEKVLPKTGIETVIITQLGDLQKPVKRLLVNAIVKHVKKLVPDYNIPSEVPFVQALVDGKKSDLKPVAPAKPDDIAVLQYTGGTTGVAKGAMLTHQNLVANMLQMRAFLAGEQASTGEVMIAPLPLYHIFAFTVCCMGMIEMGAHVVLITNPRDIPGFVKELKKWKFTAFTGLNTLFVALMNNPEFKTVDFSNLRFTIAGGMALQSKVAADWRETTGCEICEGYGMTETSPVVSVNPVDNINVGTIGVPVPSTDVKFIDEDGKDVAAGEPGELCVKGPQVMKGYWQREEATADTMTEDGYLKTGDVVSIGDDGFMRIVDRKKDMILVSGFNVYPNELEDVICSHPDIVEAAVVGVPDEKSGEAVKAFVVAANEGITADQVKQYCRENLTAYKVPKMVEFRKDLPKTNVGKILRRELRDEAK